MREYPNKSKGQGNICKINTHPLRDRFNFENQSSWKKAYSKFTIKELKQRLLVFFLVSSLLNLSLYFSFGLNLT